MLRFLIPRIALRDLPPMIAVAFVGAIVAGIYGIFHDQITYTISPEYFTKLKFDQFHYADIGLPDCVFVVAIGFLATWWVGFFCAWFLARRLIPEQPRSHALRQISIGVAIVLVCAILSATIGFGYGLWRGPSADYSFWKPMLSLLKIEDNWSFIRVAYIHYASYLGGLLGLILALVCVRPDRKSDSETNMIRKNGQVQ